MTTPAARDMAARIQARQATGGTGRAPTTNEAVVMNALLDPLLVNNAFTLRRELFEKLMDPRRDIDNECGYPKVIGSAQYREMYDRELGKRVVNVYPEETWRELPWIYEDEDPDVITPFEESWEAINKKHNVLHFMQRVDELSGIGHYGVLLIGINDGKNLAEPADGLDERGTPTAAPAGREIIYLRTLDESLCKIADFEKDPTNPRYGQPTAYLIQFIDPRMQPDAAAAGQPDTTETKVHWSRVVHIADNRLTSEVLGTPRQMAPWNRLYDLRKVLGGSGEMYWRGGFPGVSLESHPGENTQIDQDAVQTAMFKYMNGLQRYLALTGMSAKSLAPQISDPTASFEVQIKAICIMLGVPYRVFMGIEEGVVSGDQATRAWDGRLKNRQKRYITPMLINPILRRFVHLGVLVPPAEEEGWTVEWPDPYSPSEMDQAEVAAKQTEAFAKYVQGGVDTLIPPFEFLTLVCGFEKDQAEVILEAAIEHINKANPDLDDVEVPGREPPEPPEEPGKAVVDGAGKIVTLPPGTQPPGRIPRPKSEGSRPTNNGPTQNYEAAAVGWHYGWVWNFNPGQPRDSHGKWTTGAAAYAAGPGAVLEAVGYDAMPQAKKDQFFGQLDKAKGQAAREAVVQKWMDKANGSNPPAAAAAKAGAAAAVKEAAPAATVYKGGDAKQFIDNHPDLKKFQRGGTEFVETPLPKAYDRTELVNAYATRKQVTTREKVNVDDLHATQDYLHPPSLAGKLKADKDDIEAGLAVTRLNGKLLIEDGHHGIAALKLRGVKTVEVELTSFE